MRTCKGKGKGMGKEEGVSVGVGELVSPRPILPGVEVLTTANY